MAEKAKQVEGSNESPATTSVEQQSPARSNRPCSAEETLQWREFATFVKLLGVYLAQKDPALRDQVKQLIQTTTEEYDTTPPPGRPLRDELESRMRAFVGETHWKQCESYMSLSAYLDSPSKSTIEAIPDDIYDWEGLFEPETEEKTSAGMESNQPQS
jgi:hypothetical protein